MSLRAFFLGFLFVAGFLAITLWRWTLETPIQSGPLSSLRIQGDLTPCRQWKDSPRPSSQENSMTSRNLDFRGGAERSAEFSVPSFDFEIKELWRQEDFNFGIHSASKSTPVIFGNRVFASSDSSRLFALDKKSGRELWHFTFDESLRGIHSTPTLDDQFIYLGNYRGGLYKIGQANGELIWNMDFGIAFGASFLTIDSDLIVVPETVGPPNGFLVRIGKEDCQVKWRSPFLGEQSHSSPIYDQGTGLLVLGANNSVLQAFDAKSGKRVWHRKMKGQIKSTPRLFESHIYFTTWGNEFAKVRVVDGEPIWSVDIEAHSMVSPVVIEDKRLVVAANSKGVLFGVDTETGKIRWRVDARSGREEELLDYATPHLSSPVLLKSPQGSMILSYCSPRSICFISPEGHVKKRIPVPGVVTGTFFLDEFDPGNRSSLMPLTFHAGPLVMYQLLFKEGR